MRAGIQWLADAYDCWCLVIPISSGLISLLHPVPVKKNTFCIITFQPERSYPAVLSKLVYAPCFSRLDSSFSVVMLQCIKFTSRRARSLQTRTFASTTPRCKQRLVRRERSVISGQYNDQSLLGYTWLRMGRVSKNGISVEACFHVACRYEVLRGVDRKRYGTFHLLLRNQPFLRHYTESESILSKDNLSNWRNVISVTMISPNNYFNFTPLLASCAVGTLEFRCAVEPVSWFVKALSISNWARFQVRRYSPQVTAYQAWCDSIGNFQTSFWYLHLMLVTDFEQKTLQCMPVTLPSPSDNLGQPIALAPLVGADGKSHHFVTRYDKLVIAVGAYSQSKLGLILSFFRQLITVAC